MKATIIKERGIAALVEINEPALPADYVKIKTAAVAINPTDIHHTHTENAGRIGGVLGCDLSGIVEEVGAECKSDVKKGDRVYAVAHGANLSSEVDGAYAEYAFVRDGLLAKIPDGLTFEETATLGVGITTVGQMYMTMGLPLPGEKTVEGSPFFLVYGASTATGSVAIQYAKLSGFNVVTTASAKGFELAKSRGADAVFDYADPNCATQIREYTKNSLHYVLDCISTESSYKIITEALPSKIEAPTQVVTLLPKDTWPRKDVDPTAILAYTTFGKAFRKFGIDFPAIPQHHAYGVEFWKVSSGLLAEGKIKPHPVALRAGGLGGIPDGMKEMEDGKVKGVKLVYKVDETTSEGVEVWKGASAAVSAADTKQEKSGSLGSSWM